MPQPVGSQGPVVAHSLKIVAMRFLLGPRIVSQFIEIIE